MDRKLAVIEKAAQFFLLTLFCVCIICLRVFPQTEKRYDGPDDDISLVHLGDLIEVDVVGSFEFDWRGRLNPEGFLDGIENVENPIYGLCRSENEIAGAVEKEYSRILRDPKVEVRILDRSNRAVAYLDGAVRVPQRFQIKRPVRLNELIVLSGGIIDTASGEVLVFRPRLLSCRAQRPAGSESFLKTSQPSGAENFTVKISELLRGKPEANPFILSGDIVTVAEALPIYVIGGVNAPRQISSRSQTTLTRAISAAGGVSKDGDENNATIFRREGNTSRSIDVDLRKVRAGEAEDPVLKPYDIVEVAQKGRAKRKFPPVIDPSRDRSAESAKMPLRVIE